MGDGSPECEEHGGFPIGCVRCLDEARSWSFNEGAAVAFGLMGMAEAIRARQGWMLVRMLPDRMRSPIRLDEGDEPYERSTGHE